MRPGLRRLLRALVLAAACAVGTLLLGRSVPGLGGPWPAVAFAAGGLLAREAVERRRTGAELAALRQAEYHWRTEATARRQAQPDCWTQSRHLFERMAEA